MMDDNIANNIILSSGISLKEAFDNEVRAYKSNDQVIAASSIFLSSIIIYPFFF